jgi:hypothetical protein
LAVQSHPPPVAEAQSTVVNPRTSSWLLILTQVVGVEEMVKHDLSSENRASPVVTVSSVMVPSALDVNTPLTLREPVMAGLGHWAPNIDGSSVPVRFRHDDLTVQVPTTLPPHAVTLGQDPPLPLPEAPPEPGAPPEPRAPPEPPDAPPEPDGADVPPEPDGVAVELQEANPSPATAADTRTAD